MSKKDQFLLFISLVFVTGIIFLQFQQYSYPDQAEIHARIEYLDRVVKQPLTAEADIPELGKESHEFMLFSYAFSTYAATNIGLHDSTYQSIAISLIGESIRKALDPSITKGYGIDSDSLYVDSIQDFSILYLGHLNLMLGCYRLLTNDSSYDQLNDRISKSLFDRFHKTSFLSLESYPDYIWIPDNTAALASLRLHSLNTGGAYGSICNEWISYARSHFLDDKTNLLYSTIHPETGLPEEEPRGSMLGWSISFIYQFDEAFAKELYQHYKKHFSQDYLVFRLFKEHYQNSATTSGDIDSGPIVLGYSIPANQFALGNAVLAGDYRTAKKLQRLVAFGASRNYDNGELKYDVRFVDMNVSPMAEAMMLYALTMRRWDKVDKEANLQ